MTIQFNLDNKKKMKFEIIFTIFLIVTIKTHEPIKTFEQFKVSNLMSLISIRI